MKYRITKRYESSYQIEVRRWYWPFWTLLGDGTIMGLAFATESEALQYAISHSRNFVVKEIH